MNAPPHIRQGQPAQNASGERGLLPPYLALLHLSSHDVQAALDELLREPLNPDDRRTFHRELGHENWRYALAAAVRLVGARCADLDARAGAGQVRAQGMSEGDVDVLWGRIEHGNWVVP